MVSLLKQKKHQTDKKEKVDFVEKFHFGLILSLRRGCLSVMQVFFLNSFSALEKGWKNLKRWNLVSSLNLTSKEIVWREKKTSSSKWWKEKVEKNHPHYLEKKFQALLLLLIRINRQLWSLIRLITGFFLSFLLYVCFHLSLTFNLRFSSIFLSPESC